MKTITALSLLLISGCQSSSLTSELDSQLIKAREAEGKSIASAIGRSQMVYHVENKEFTNSLEQLSIKTSLISSAEHYSFNIQDVTSNRAIITAKSKSDDIQISDFVNLVTYDDEYSNKLCKLKQSVSDYSSFEELDNEECYDF